jgi:D-aminopeptidase
VVAATDAPLIPVQCSRLSRRIAVGLGRVGGYGHDSSGDIFLAFSTGNHIHDGASTPTALRMLPNDHIDPLFHAVADATEESIVNALCAATTTTGRLGRTAHALPTDRLAEIFRSTGP